MYNAYEMSDSMMKCKIKMTRKSMKDISDRFTGTYIGDVVNKENCLCFRYTEFDTGARCFVLYEDDEDDCDCDCDCDCGCCDEEE